MREVTRLRDDNVPLEALRGLGRPRREAPRSIAMLNREEHYYENGLMVFTERFHLRRGSCCGSGCRHCPFAHEAVSVARRATLPPPRPFLTDTFPPTGAETESG